MERPIQSGDGQVELLLELLTSRRHLKNRWYLPRYEIGDLPEGMHRARREEVVSAAGIDHADVNLFDLIAKDFDDLVGFCHRGVNLASVSDVEAHPGIGELVEDPAELANCSTHRLSFVHVLDVKERPELLPGGVVADDVRVCDDRPSCLGEIDQPIDDVGLSVPS